MKKAFTLIELLIVVAIIAILAAIAVPNFLEAQTRAKIARVKADMRTMDTAINAFAVDDGKVPPSHTNDNTGGFIEPPDARFRALTTPVAYLTSVPTISPFRDPNEQYAWFNYYQYTTREGVVNTGDLPYCNGWYRVAAGKPEIVADTNVWDGGPEWMILDRGPDKTFFFFYFWNGQTWGETLTLYDPTNGTTSQGEIARWAGGSGEF